MKFRTKILQAGKTATGIEVPPDVVEALGSGKRPAVRVTINGYVYRSTVAVMGGMFMLPLSAENRAGAGAAGGDEVEVDLELDTAPREVALPEDFSAALDAEPVARAFFEGLSFSHKRGFVEPIGQAKTPETRKRRIAKAIEMLREGRKP